MGVAALGAGVWCGGAFYIEPGIRVRGQGGLGAWLTGRVAAPTGPPGLCRARLCTAGQSCRLTGLVGPPLSGRVMPGSVGLGRSPGMA
jgi:hypothetical protein